ncbi:MAG: hypothetical protein V4637_19015 [Pseudomonadota bacterium]
MIFMSQSGLTDTTRERDWDRWYFEHLTIMVTVPGISSAQRFKTVTPGYPPSLAMYSVASAQVFQDPYYLSVRGMGEWLSLIDRRYYRRNLFDGLKHAPQVAAGEVLLVADREAPEAGLAAIEWSWLAVAGIDRSTPYRGIAVVDADDAESLSKLSDIAVYEPASSYHKPPQPA